MEFSALIDKLDDVLASAKRVPLGSDLRVDQDELSAIVRQLRGSIPEEVKQAHWITERRSEMVAEAQKEVAQILEEAREEAARLLGCDEVAKAAERRATQLVENAETHHRDLLDGAEQYALHVLDGLEAYLEKIAGAVNRGRARLAGGNEHEAAVPPPDRHAEAKPELVARSLRESAADGRREHALR